MAHAISVQASPAFSLGASAGNLNLRERIRVVLQWSYRAGDREARHHLQLLREFQAWDWWGGECVPRPPQPKPQASCPQGSGRDFSLSPQDKVIRQPEEDQDLDFPCVKLQEVHQEAMEEMVMAQKKDDGETPPSHRRGSTTTTLSQALRWPRLQWRWRRQGST